MMNNVISLKKKAYDPNLGPSLKDDQYCAAPYLFAEMWMLWGDPWRASRGGGGGGRLSDTGPICARDEMQEFEEWWDSLGPAPRHEHIVCEMVTIILRLFVWPQEDLQAMPRGLDRVGVVPRVWIDEPEAMIDGAVRVTLRLETAISTPAIADDRRAWFDPVTYNSHQRVGGPVRNGNKKCSAGPSFYTAKHPLTLNRVPSTVLAPTDLALVNLDDLIRATDFLRAARHEIEHGFPAELPPIGDRMVTEVEFVFD